MNKVPNNVYSQALQAYFLSFQAYANSAGLKRLFSYGVPCMYSGIPMIDASKINKLAKNGHFSGGISKITEILKPYEESMMPIEKNLFAYLKDVSKTTPDKKFTEIMKELEPEHRKNLHSKQAVTFFKLKEFSKNFPPELQEEFSLLMQNTDKKLQNVPVKIPFSSYEFQYRLQKLTENITVEGEKKDLRTMKKILNYASLMRDTSDLKTRGYQGHILRQIRYIIEKSPLKNNKEIKKLLDTSYNRLYDIPIKTPFSRKAFLYDLQKITSQLKNPELEKEILNAAHELPTSRNNLSAFILKFQDAPSERLCNRLVSDSFGSIEHLLPQSKGGKDELANYGPATCYYNSLRSNNDFIDHLHAHPEIKQNCQKSVDYMIELANNGIFDKVKLPKEYILWFKNTVAKLSNNELVLNTEKLH